MGYYSQEELTNLGFVRLGKKVLIERSVQIIGAERISIEDNVRVDAFCILSAGASGIHIGNHIHIGAGCYLFGGGGRLELADFSGLSPSVKVFTASDDFTEGWLRGPIVDSDYRKVKTGDVTFQENAVVACGSVISPGVTLGRNCSVCALTLITRDVEENAIVSGNPSRLIGRRDPVKSDELMQRFRLFWASTENG